VELVYSLAFQVGLVFGGWLRSIGVMMDFGDIRHVAGVGFRDTCVAKSDTCVAKSDTRQVSRNPTHVSRNPTPVSRNPTPGMCREIRHLCREIRHLVGMVLALRAGSCVRAYVCAFLS